MNEHILDLHVGEEMRIIILQYICRSMYLLFSYRRVGCEMHNDLSIEA